MLTISVQFSFIQSDIYLKQVDHSVQFSSVSFRVILFNTRLDWVLHWTLFELILLPLDLNQVTSFSQYVIIRHWILFYFITEGT